MPAQGNVISLAGAKAALRVRIAAQREAIAVAARGAVQPIVFLDRCLEIWRGLPPVIRISGSAFGAWLAGRCLRSPVWRSALQHSLPVVFGALGQWPGFCAPRNPSPDLPS